MTFKEMQDEVLAHGFDESYRPRVQTWLNTAQARIARSIEVSDKFGSVNITTIIGTDEYLSPGKFETQGTKVQSIVDRALGFQLDYVLNPAKLFAVNANGTYTGRPVEYSFSTGSPNKIILSPVPDAVYTLTLFYYQRPSDLNDDGDTSTLPEDFHDIMCSWTLSRAYRSEDDAQMSQFYMAEYERDLRLLGADNTDKTDDPAQVPGTWGS